MKQTSAIRQRPAHLTRRLLAVVTAGLVVAAVGCAERIHLQEPYLQRVGTGGASRLQVYTAGDIELGRLIGSRDEISVSDAHRLRLEQGQYVEEIVLKKNTPGAIVSSDSTMELVVSFEPPDENGEERTLIFRRVDRAEPRTYWLWDGERDLFVCNPDKFQTSRTSPSCSSSVSYGGRRYEVLDLRSGHLDIKKELIDDSRTDRRTVKGRRLP